MKQSSKISFKVSKSPNSQGIYLWIVPADCGSLQGKLFWHACRLAIDSSPPSLGLNKPVNKPPVKSESGYGARGMRPAENQFSSTYIIYIYIYIIFLYMHTYIYTFTLLINSEDLTS